MHGLGLYAILSASRTNSIKDGKRKYDCWSIDDMIEHTPTRIVVPFPAEFKREDFWKQSMMRFEFSTDSGKPSGPYRTIKYKHGVKVTLGE